MTEETFMRRVPPPPPPEEPVERVTTRPREERIVPEQAVETTVKRSRLERIEPEGERGHLASKAVSRAIVLRPVKAISPIGKVLSSRSTLRQAFVLQEILGPPKALRNDPPIW